MCNRLLRNRITCIAKTNQNFPITTVRNDLLNLSKYCWHLTQNYWLSRRCMFLEDLRSRSSVVYLFLFFLLNSLSIPPGTKISLTGTIAVKENLLMLDSNNTKVLGGEVEKLKEKWELNKVSIIYYDFLVGKVVYCIL